MRTIRNGDLFAFRPSSGLWSTLIKLRTCSRVTHVGLAYWVDQTLCVLEARERHGVRLFPLRRYLTDNPGYAIDWYELADDKYRLRRADGIEWALEQWGKKYNTLLQFLRSYGFLARRLCDQLNLPADIEPERFHCSEFCASFLRKCGYNLAINFQRIHNPGDVIYMRPWRRRGELGLVQNEIRLLNGVQLAT